MLIIILYFLDLSQSKDISPSKLEDDDDDILNDPELDSGIEKIETMNARKGRQNNFFNFLLYWITTTSTSTSTSYTSTGTLVLEATNGQNLCIPGDVSSTCRAG